VSSVWLGCWIPSGCTIGCAGTKIGTKNGCPLIPGGSEVTPGGSVGGVTSFVIPGLVVENPDVPVVKPGVGAVNPNGLVVVVVVPNGLEVPVVNPVEGPGVNPVVGPAVKPGVVGAIGVVVVDCAAATDEKSSSMRTGRMRLSRTGTRPPVSCISPRHGLVS
jgi:hypothetical protein